MGTAFYVYSSKSEYEKVYEGRIGEKFVDVNIDELYVKENKKGEPKLWVVTETNQMKESPRLEKTVVHFRNGSADGYFEGDETKVFSDTVKYNPKSNRLEFFPQLLRKPLLEFRVDRFYGDKPKRRRTVKWSEKFYDLSTDRVNFILSSK